MTNCRKVRDMRKMRILRQRKMRMIRQQKIRKIRKMREVERCPRAAARDRWPRQPIICHERSVTDSMAAIATAGLLFVMYYPSLHRNSLYTGTTLFPMAIRVYHHNMKSNCRAHTAVTWSSVRCHLHTSPAITGFGLSCHTTSRSRTTAADNTIGIGIYPVNRRGTHFATPRRWRAPVCAATSTPSRWSQASACATTPFPLFLFFWDNKKASPGPYTVSPSGHTYVPRSVLRGWPDPKGTVRRLASGSRATKFVVDRRTSAA